MILAYPSSFHPFPLNDYSYLCSTRTRQASHRFSNVRVVFVFIGIRQQGFRLKKNISMAVGKRNDARKAKGWTLVFRASSYLLRGRLARWRKSLAYSAGKACSERFHCSMNLSIISVPFSVQHPRSITMMVLTKISLMV